MAVFAFVQVRMSSSRLPGKVLKPICGKPMLEQLLLRLKLSQAIDDIVVLTSTDRSDDCIEEFCRIIGQACFRGDLDNVLDRFYQASLVYEPDHIVRITGDCPLIDWGVVDHVVRQHTSSDCDYTSNTLTPTYPDGLDVEVFTQDCLKKMHIDAKKDIEKEHVTYYCYQHPDEFKVQNVSNPLGDFSNERWTVDTEEDFSLVTKIFENLYPKKPQFTFDDIVQMIKNNHAVFSINRHLKRNEGLNKGE